MQKVGLYALLAILGFALVFVAIPTGKNVDSETGAILHDVKLTLYPSSDPEAVWRFAANKVTNDPINNLTELTGLSAGKRFIREKNETGELTGQETLEATLTTKKLTINEQDDLITDKAKINLIRHCATVDLVGNDQTPVKIEQGFGFSTPLGIIDSPVLKMRLTDLRMSFQIEIEEAGEDSETVGDLDAREKCVDGKRITMKDDE